jgi:hypothetical protein
MGEFAVTGEVPRGKYNFNFTAKREKSIVAQGGQCFVPMGGRASDYALRILWNLA